MPKSDSAAENAFHRWCASLSPEENRAYAQQALAMAEVIYTAMHAYKAEHSDIPYGVVLKALRGIQRAVEREMARNA
jgi:hypothetical protein